MYLSLSPIVLKFGGTSVGSPNRFKTVVDVVKQYVEANERVVVIVSALDGVTDRLAEVGVREAALPAHEIDAFISWLLTRHRLHAAAVLSLHSQRVFDTILQEYLAELDGLLRTLQNERYPADVRDTLLAAGERLAMHILAFALADAGLGSCAKDAAELVRTDQGFGHATVCLDSTCALLRKWYDSVGRDQVPVITGFIGSTEAGATTTLGRGGSDYSASLVATALGAKRLERWTDIDGVYTSDPRLDRTARKLTSIVMQDAVSWNHAGKIGLHRKALDPLLEARIPMQVRSIDLPEDAGTTILPKEDAVVLKKCG